MNSLKARTQFKVGRTSFTIYRLQALEECGLLSHLRRLPVSIRILLENLLRSEDGKNVKREDIEALARWNPHRSSSGSTGGSMDSRFSATPPEYGRMRPLAQKMADPSANFGGRGNDTKEIAFTPARVILQDFTGVPCVVDLAAMRDQIKQMGGDPKKINPLQPVDLVIDHSVQVDVFGSPDAFKKNTEMEFGRNLERYKFLRWGQQAFRNFRVVPPGTGIVHQVNLEYLASVVMTRLLLSSSGSTGGSMDSRLRGNDTLAFPDTLVGTDSHTTMINGLGVLGWGVGGIEAEAAMLGQPISMLIPEVVGFKLTGKLAAGATATDLVLTVTERLRKKGVVGKFVEFFGDGLDSLSLADRATVANMAPEYGATTGFFPVDQETLNYLRLTGRSEEQVRLVEVYCKEQGLFRTKDSQEPVFSATLELDLGTVEASLAGPKRPQDRVALKDVKRSFYEALSIKEAPTSLDAKRVNNWQAEGGSPKPLASQLQTPHPVPLPLRGRGEGKGEADAGEIRNGSVVIAAITSCTNTSNPAVMIGAGILAKKAVERGLNAKPWVKTSLAPGSKVVMDYLGETGLLPYLEKLRFHLVGYGCTTCIGNSGPLPEAIGEAVRKNDLVVAAVLSGNRNFEGRINSLVRANYLASPPLVVAYALAGTVDTDLTAEPLGSDSSGKPVYLRDLWPSEKEIADAMNKVQAKMFQKQYASVFEGDAAWQSMKIPTGDTFVWDEKSTYVKHPPYFENMPSEPAPLRDIQKARVLVVVGDSVTTDHISPAGSIPKDSPAGKYLISKGVDPKDFNSYGSRRGNHEVMMRGTFANIRLRNLLAPGTEGGVTRYFGPAVIPAEAGIQTPGSLIKDFGDDRKRGDVNKRQVISIYDAAMEYKKQGIPLMVIAGKEYGAGSSRDWAAKGPALLGVKAVIAESFERIHRSNLIGMGVLPLEFETGQNAASLGLTGEEIYSIEGIADHLTPGKRLKITVGAGFKPAPTTGISHSSGKLEAKRFTVKCRIDTPVELAYYRAGGILQYVLRQLMKGV